MTEAAFAVEPIWDAMIAERDGRGPAEFEGHETWDDSDEATEAEARGRAEADATAEMFLGWDPLQPREWGPSQFDPDDGEGQDDQTIDDLLDEDIPPMETPPAPADLELQAASNGRGKVHAFPGSSFTALCGVGRNGDWATQDRFYPAEEAIGDRCHTCNRMAADQAA